MANGRNEVEELMKIMYQLRCELSREEDARLYSDVTFKLDRICTDIRSTDRGGGIPWKTLHQAKRKIDDIQKEVLVKGSHHTSSHGNEAGTQKEMVGSVLPKK